VYEETLTGRPHEHDTPLQKATSDNENVFKDVIISNSRNFIPTVKVFKCPPGKMWCRPLPDSVRNLVKLISKEWKNVSKLEV